ncbi:MAG: DUF669 domain-containing protein [Firmicutes bacterium HGW-Firmicutes-17]|jgi:hypothetical protein|nr:MAG: DUF669 domain-containing protein [Firmicutes bacterium HGW-Firmicutes-17]
MSEFVEERELGWDDQIENDSPDFILLPAGDYDFVVAEYERQRHNGSEKLPPCNKAVVSLKFETPEGSTTIKHNLFLHTKTEGMICSFFTAIGLRKKGEKFTMDFNAAVGMTGRAKVSVREWTNESSEKKIFNDIKKFYEPDESKPAAVGYTPGSF